MPDLIGRLLKKRYRIDAYLGRGGMAEVYRAYDTRRSYPVAIKFMHADLAEDLEFVRRFRQEADNLAALAHDNIVRFYSLERDGLLTFLVMDYVEGITLRTLLAQADGPLPLSQVTYIFPQVCQALHYAHEEGFIHRDVKPGNIMLQSDPVTGTGGRVLVTDFGIAKATDAATIMTYMPGAPAYMSPEQCRSEMLDGRSDVYSLGIVLYEMVTGRRPFAGQTESITGSTREKLRWEQMHAVPPPPREVKPDIPAALERVILKALAKQPEERFSSALAFLEAFKVAVGEVGDGEAPQVVVNPSAVVPGLVSPPWQAAPPAQAISKALVARPGRRGRLQENPLLAVPGLILVLVIVIGAAWLILAPDFKGEEKLTGPQVLSPPAATDVNTPPPKDLVNSSTGPAVEFTESPTLILLRDTHVRVGPGEEYAAFDTVKKGTRVEVVARNPQQTWLQIVHPNGPQGRGWIEIDDVADVEAPVPETIVSPVTDTPIPTVTPAPTKTPIPTTTPAISLTGPQPPAQGLSPDAAPFPRIISVQTIPEQVIPGQPFRLRVEAINEGGPTVDGYINVSSPDNAILKIVSHSATGRTDDNYVVEPGAKLYHYPEGGRTQAIYRIAEVRIRDWPRGAIQHLEVEVTPRDGAQTTIVYTRVSLSWKTLDDIYIEPNNSSTIDQQGFPVYSYQFP